MRRILIDYTQTFTCDMNTGIQRVVKKMILGIKEVSCEYDVQVCSICCLFGRYFDMPHQTKTVSGFAMSLRAAYQKAKSVVKNHPRLSLYLREIFPPFIRQGLINIYFQACNARKFLTGQSRQIRYQEGDVLVLLEAGWICPNYRVIRKAKGKGVIVVQMIHDLIPLHYQEFVGHESHTMFSEWIVKTTEYTDLYICNSRHTRDELKDFFRSINFNWEGKIGIERFKLGCDIKRSNIANESKVTPSIRGLFSDDVSKEGYVCVGTVEARKNQQYLLDVFERVWLKSPEAKLFLVGRCNESCAELKTRINRHPQINKKLFWLQGINDLDMQFVLTHVKAMIFPTLAEGFGLPIVESLSMGVPVFANHLNVLKETGGEFCSYFNSNDPCTLVDLILDIELKDHWPTTSPLQKFRGTTWEESAREFITKILSSQPV